MLRGMRWTFLRNLHLRMDPKYVIGFQAGEMSWGLKDC